MSRYETNLMNEASSSNAYSRAVAILQEGKILSYEEEFVFRGFVELKGTVQGSNGDNYSVSVDLSTTGEDIVSYSCTCPASWEYYGMCKHEIALVLSFLNRHGILHLSEVRRTVAAGDSKKKPVQTSYAVSHFLRTHAFTTQHYAARSAPAPEILSEEEPVELTCIISQGIDTKRSWREDDGLFWSVGLKISRGKAHYIVKSVMELVNAWRFGLVHSYGKNLEFVHRRSAFSDQSNALLDVLAPIVEAQRTMFGAVQEKYHYDSLNYSAKSIPLTEDAFARVLDLLVGSKVIYEIDEDEGYYRTQKVKNTITVTTGDPELSAVIVEEGDGYKVSLYPNDLRCVRDGSLVFVLTRNAILKTSERWAKDMGLLCGMLLPARYVYEVSAADMPSFSAAAMPALRAHTQLTVPEGFAEQVPPAPEFMFHIGLEGENIVCRSTIEYGDEKLDLFEPAKKGQPIRDIAAEVRAQQTVASYFPFGDYDFPNYSEGIGDDPYMLGSWYEREHRASKKVLEPPFFFEHDDERYYMLFTDGLRELSDIGTVLLSDRLRSVVVRQSPSVAVRASVHGGLLDIEVRADDMTPAELVEYLSTYERKQRYLRLSNGDIVRLDGSVKALAELGDGLGLDPKNLVENAKGLPLNRTLYVDTMLKRAGGVQFERNRPFKAIIREFDTIADLDISAPDSLQDILRSYQDEGFKWLYTLGKLGFGGVLADDMGLGKTLQMLAYFLARKEEGVGRPAIVVCPASLVYNWIAEIERFAPQLSACAVVGSKQARMRIIEAAESAGTADAADATGACDVFVTSYDLLKRDIELYNDTVFSCAVLDEAQYIKNSSTLSAKAAKMLQADQRFALTGTPIENRLGELWSIFDFLMPGVLGSERAFDARYSQAIANQDEQASRQLQSLVGPFILRRLKKDVLVDLPDKNESVVFSVMEGEQGKLYRANEARIAHLLSDQRPEEFAGMKLQILAELTKLRQLCCDPHLLYDEYNGDSAKLETCIELLRNACEGGHGVLLFSQFTSMLAIIGERLSKEKIPYFELTGVTSKEERVRLVERFQAGEAPVFLISLKAGGVGLNLTAADIVIHYDPWWNLAAQNQATDRAHRIGQTKEISVFKLIAKDTIEERIVEMQEKKRDLADAVLGGEAVTASAISREDLLALLNA